MPALLILGLGYTANRLAGRLRRDGWSVTGTTRDGRDGTLRFASPEAAEAIRSATHILSSIPPAGERDPVLDAHAGALGRTPWLGYLSSTGVYGDAGGAWVDESAPIDGGRRTARAAADAAWLALGARVFRLPGIYGPGRSPLDRVATGRAHRTGLAEQVFSRVHVDDIVTGVVAALTAPAGAYNLSDDLPASQDVVVEEAARLLGLPPPPLVALDSLSPAQRGFYRENRRVANGKARRVLGWSPAYPDYRAGLRALSATTSPTIASAAPAADSMDQR